MNALLINITRRRLLLLASTVLLVLGAVFAAPVVIAEDGPTSAVTTTAKPPIPDCLKNGWPPTGEKEKWLIQAFDTALHDSAMSAPNSSPWPTGPALRTKLLDTKNNFKAPKDAIKDILKGQGHVMALPDDLVIIFYFEEPKPTPTPNPSPSGSPKDDKETGHPHPNHCYLVLYLDPVGTAAPKSFQEHVMCCYDPYK
jgi:hypothetical protein